MSGVTLESDDSRDEVRAPANALNDPVITDEKRLRNFTTFFKNYMSVSAVLAAAAPIPVALWDLIPGYDSQRRMTATVASLTSFLALAYIFFNRAPLGRIWFGSYLTQGPPGTAGQRTAGRLLALAPLLLIGGSLGSLLLYLRYLDESVRDTEIFHLTGDVGLALADQQLGQIPDGPVLVILLLGFFVLAEAAFIVMALREYTQDLLGISDRALIRSIESADPTAKNAARLVANGQATADDHGGLLLTIYDKKLDYQYSVSKPAFRRYLAEFQEAEELPLATSDING